ncbi:hypothetical protein FACS1894140_7020 [Spirochaetia bacterium]|nr:hypothetical protein FACS1894140_7020 [Spirochaetia bacterium]
MKPDQYKYGMPVTQGKILAKGRQYVKKVTEKQTALGISAETVAAVGTAQNNAEASRLVTTDKEHARPVDYRYNDECFGILENLLADIQRRFFKIPPCTQEDLDMTYKMGYY